MLNETKFFCLEIVNNLQISAVISVSDPNSTSAIGTASANQNQA